MCVCTCGCGVQTSLHWHVCVCTLVDMPGSLSLPVCMYVCVCVCVPAAPPGKERGHNIESFYPTCFCLFLVLLLSDKNKNLTGKVKNDHQWHHNPFKSDPWAPPGHPKDPGEPSSKKTFKKRLKRLHSGTPFCSLFAFFCVLEYVLSCVFQWLLCSHVL